MTVSTVPISRECTIVVIKNIPSSQQESESLSANVRLGLQFRYQQGKVQVNHNWFLGYTKDEDGHLIIDPEQADVVKRIYREYLNGDSLLKIKRSLEADGVLNGAGRGKWNESNIKQILTNEKYIGDALLQKRFTVDFLSKKMKDNEGEVQQYYVQNSHPAIIDPDEFDEMQVELERRKKLGRPAACQSLLSTKLVCGDCEGFYGSMVGGSNTKYRRMIWRCNDKYKGDPKCATPHVTEEDVKQKFLEALNSVMQYRDELIANCRLVQEALCDYANIDAEINELHREIEVVAELSRKAIYENAHTPINQDEWHERNNGYLERHRKASERVTELEGLKRERQSKSFMLDSNIRNLNSHNEALEEFDDRLWIATIIKVVVRADGVLIFEFRDGTVT